MSLPSNGEHRLLFGPLFEAGSSALSSALFGSNLGTEVAGVEVGAGVDCVEMGRDACNGFLS